MPIKAILLDIEGTTTDIRFVHNVLFPYAAKHLKDFVLKNFSNPDVRKALEETKKTVAEEHGKTLDDEGAVEQLLRWITEDRKHTALKSLQGMIWEQGYKNGDYQSHLYNDVPPAFKRWADQGLALAVYSSGSIQAQQLLFGYTPFGNLNPYFTAYFDTTTGPKKEPASYARIAKELHVKPEEILFLSDHPDEIAAAQQAGCHVIQLLRDGQAPAAFPSATTFERIDPAAFPLSPAR